MKIAGKLPGRVAVVGGVVIALVACSDEFSLHPLDAATWQIESKVYMAAFIQLKKAFQKDPKLAEERFLLRELLRNSSDVAGTEIEQGQGSWIPWIP